MPPGIPIVPRKEHQIEGTSETPELASDTSGTGSRAISPEALRIVQFGRLARALKICISKMLRVMLKLLMQGWKHWLGGWTATQNDPFSHMANNITQESRTGLKSSSGVSMLSD